MAQLAFGIAGAALGSFIPGSFLGVSMAGWGWMAGSMVGGLFGKTQKTKLYGPRLGDLRVQGATYGAPLPKVWGTVRIAGNIIWCGGIKETKNTKTEKSGGKGGPKYKTTTTTYTYSADFAVAFGEGPIEGVRRIWADGKLIYDRTSGASVDGLVSGAVSVGGFRLYDGTFTQEPDPLMESYLGVGNVPGYRGIAYLVMDDLQLGNFGNRIPNLEFEVVANTNTQIRRFKTIDAEAVPEFKTDVDYNRTRVTYVGEDGSFCLMRSGQFDQFGPNPHTRIQLYNVDFSGVVTEIFEPFCINNSCNYEAHFDAIVYPQRLEEPGVVWYVKKTTPIGQEKNHAFYVVPVFDASSGGMLMSVKAVWNWEKTASPFSGLGQHIIEKNGTMMFTSSAGGVWLASNRGGSYNTLNPYNFTGEYPVQLWQSGVAGQYLGYNYYGGALGPTEAYVIFQHPTLNQMGIQVYDHNGTFKYFKEFDFKPFSSATYETYFFCNTDGNIGVIAPSYVSFNWFHAFYTINIGTGKIESPGTSAGSSGNRYWGGGLIGNDVFMIYDDWESRDPTSQYYTLSLDGDRVPVANIIADLCEEAGLSALDFDTSSIGATTYGYVKTQPMSARAAIEPLQQAYFIDGVESEGKIRFKTRPGTHTGITISYDDLGSIEYGDEPRDPVEITRIQDMELPYKLSVKYINHESSYQQGIQEAMRLGTYGHNNASIEVPICLSNDEAKVIADVLLYSAWNERTIVKGSANIKYAKIEPGDLISVQTATKNIDIRLTKVDNRLPGVLDFEGFYDNVSSYQSDKPAANIVQEEDIVVSVGPSSLIPLDLPMLRSIDDNTGFYEAVSSTSGFVGAGIFISQDSGTTYNEIDNIFDTTIHGNTTTLLAAPANPNLIDYANEVDVSVGTTGNLYSISESQLYDNTTFENYAAIGAHGRWEIVQFANATDNGDGTYTLSTLVRGIRGTEWACSTHTATDKFVLLDSSALSRYIPPAIDSEEPYGDATYLYKCVSFGKFIDTTYPIAFECHGVAKKPFSPTNGAYTLGSDIVFTWDRRTRLIVDELPQYSDLPLGEVDENGAAYERYKARVYIPGSPDDTLVRTVDNLTTPTFTYTNAQQIADGTDSIDFYITVCQKSTTVGDGYLLTIGVER